MECKNYVDIKFKKPTILEQTHVEPKKNSLSQKQHTQNRVVKTTELKRAETSMKSVFSLKRPKISLFNRQKV